MTIRREFTCDRKGCPSKQWGAGSDARPPAWVMYREPHDHRKFVTPDGWRDTYLFCSVTCLRAFLDAMPPPDDPALGIVFTCDNCEKEILMRPGDEWPVWIEKKQEKGSPVRLGFCSDDCLYHWMSFRECEYWGNR